MDACRPSYKVSVFNQSWNVLKYFSGSHKYQVPQEFVQQDSRLSVGRIDGRTDILRLIVNFATAVSTGVEVGMHSWAVKNYANRYFFRISRQVKCNIRLSDLCPGRKIGRDCPQKRPSKYPNLICLLLCSCGWTRDLVYQRRMQTRCAFLVCNLNVAARVQGNYNALWCVQGGIESLLRVMMVFLTTYE
jgi:hypothetical protein